MTFDGYQSIKCTKNILSVRCMKVISMRLQDKATYEEIANKLHMSTKTISKIIKSARREFPGVKELRK